MADEPKFPSDLADRFQVRMPQGLRDRLRDAAEANNRSMNSEIVSRLESTFEELGPYSAIGMNAFIKRLEFGIEASEELAFKLAAELRMAAGVVASDDAPIRAAIAKYAAANDMNLAVATQCIITDWLREKGYLPN